MYALFDHFFSGNDVNDFVIKDIPLRTFLLGDLNVSDTLDDARNKLKIENYRKVKYDDSKTVTEMAEKYYSKNSPNYLETLKIKNKITEILKNEKSSTKKHIQAVNYFIVDWGGVRGNKPEKILSYIIKFQDIEGRPSNETNNVYNIEGVATWSKYLSVLYPEWAHIYDARTCFSLNAIAYLYESETPVWKIKGGASNSKVVLCEDFVNRSVYKVSRKEQQNNSFYSNYLDLLGNVASQVDDADASQIEMFLFKIADGELWEDVIKKAGGKNSVINEYLIEWRIQL